MELRIELSSALSNLSTKVAEVAGTKAALEEARGDNALMVEAVDGFKSALRAEVDKVKLRRVHLLPLFLVKFCRVHQQPFVHALLRRV